MSDDVDRPIRLDTPQAAMNALSRIMDEGRRLATGLEKAARDMATATKAWKLAEARSVAASAASSADKRSGEALIANEALYEAYLVAEATHDQIIERLRWNKVAATGAMSALSQHKAEAQLSHIPDHGLAEDREPVF